MRSIGAEQIGGGAVYWGGKTLRHDYSAGGTTVIRRTIARLGTVPRPLFGPATLMVSGTKSTLLQLIERAQLEILYRHPR